MLSLRALRHFVVVAEEQHFSRAAARLHLTQSALSRSIQSLEAVLGVKLFDRSASAVLLTRPGEAVLRRARRVLAEAAALQHETSQIKGLENGEVSMGVGVFPAANFLPSLLTELAQNYPGIAMRIEIESWKRLHQMLEHDTLDFVVAITHSLPPSSEFLMRPLPAQHGGLFVRQNHPLLGLPPGDIRNRLPAYRLAATHLPQRAKAQLAELYRLPDANDLPLALECNSMEGLKSVALHSDTVLFCMREAVAGALAQSVLVQLPLDYSSETTLTCNIIHHARRTLSPAATKVVELIEELMAGGNVLASSP